VPPLMPEHKVRTRTSPAAGRGCGHFPDIHAAAERYEIARGRALSQLTRDRRGNPAARNAVSEEQLGPGEIGQFFLHGCANRLPRTAHDPLINGGERPHNCDSELR